MQLELVVSTFSAVQQTRSRQQKVEHLAQCVSRLAGEALPPG